MYIKILKQNYNLKDVPMLRCNLGAEANAENFDTKLSASLFSAVSDAIIKGGAKLAIDIDSFVTGKVKRSYVCNEAAECIDELLDSGIIPQNFTVYFVGGVLSESKYDKLYESEFSETVEEQQSFGDAGDDLKPKFEEFDATLKKDKAFKYCLADFMRQMGVEANADLCLLSGISNSVASRITTQDVTPKRDTIAAICIGLALNFDEAQQLYNSAGYYLGKTNFVDRVIRFFIKERVYDIDEVNYCLDYYRYPPLGARSRDDRIQFRSSKG